MKTIILGIITLMLIFSYIGCSSNGTIITPTGGGSDLTRIGKFISFTSNFDGDYDIFIVQVDANGNIATSNLVYTTNPHNLTNAFSNNTDKQSNWSPDGRILVFSSTQGTSQEIHAFFFNADGSIDSTITPNPRNLFSSSGNWDNNPSFSPDGNNLIWDRRYDNDGSGVVDSADARDLYIGDITGSGNTFQVQNIRAIVTTTGNDEYNPKWSPRISVRRIAYEYQSSATASDHDVYIIDPLDTTNNVNYYNPGKSGYPAWEPSCTKLIFELNSGNSGFYKIVSAPYPTAGTPTDLVQSSTWDNRYPTWLPNGNLVAYINFQTGFGNIYVINASGGNSSKLLPAQFDAANNLWPAW